MKSRTACTKPLARETFGSALGTTGSECFSGGVPERVGGADEEEPGLDILLALL
jgi:hypothetical protein